MHNSDNFVYAKNIMLQALAITGESENADSIATKFGELVALSLFKEMLLKLPAEVTQKVLSEGQKAYTPEFIEQLKAYFPETELTEMHKNQVKTHFSKYIETMQPVLSETQVEQLRELLPE